MPKILQDRRVLKKEEAIYLYVNNNNNIKVFTPNGWWCRAVGYMKQDVILF